MLKREVAILRQVGVLGIPQRTAKEELGSIEIAIVLTRFGEAKTVGDAEPAIPMSLRSFDGFGQERHGFLDASRNPTCISQVPEEPEDGVRVIGTTSFLQKHIGLCHRLFDDIALGRHLAQPLIKSCRLAQIRKTKFHFSHHQF